MYAEILDYPGKSVFFQSADLPISKLFQRIDNKKIWHLLIDTCTASYATKITILVSNFLQ